MFVEVFANNELQIHDKFDRSCKLRPSGEREIVGVQRAQISKLENGKSNITIGTMLKVMNAPDCWFTDDDINKNRSQWMTSDTHVILGY